MKSYYYLQKLKHRRKKMQSGQSLVEFTVIFPVFILLTFAVIEVSRLAAFRNVLDATARMVAMQIASEHLMLLREGLIVPENGSQQGNTLQNANYTLESHFFQAVDQKVFDYLSSFPTFRMGFRNPSRQNANTMLIEGGTVSELPARDVLHELTIKINPSAEAQGVYVQINACLPSLFSGIFKGVQDVLFSASNQNSLQRNCLGQFGSPTLLGNLGVHARTFQYSLKTAVFVPWPANSYVYMYGVARPQKVAGVVPDLIPFNGGNTLPSVPSGLVFSLEKDSSNSYKRVLQALYGGNVHAQTLSALKDWKMQKYKQ